MFNELAAAMSDFPSLLCTSTWVFVPGDNDPWASAFSAGASVAVPRNGVPDIFTSRIKRAFATAKSEAGAGKKDVMDGEAIWTSNPAKLSCFGPAHEVAVFRDDIAGRFRRTAVRLGQASRERPEQQPAVDRDTQEDIVMSSALPTTEDVAQDTQITESDASAPSANENDDHYGTSQAKKLILSLLPQSTLSPFPLATKPVHWDYASSLSLYPLPHTLILADAESAPFAMTFEGCHVLNPGRLVCGGGRRKMVQWCEYDLWTKRGTLREDWIG